MLITTRELYDGISPDAEMTLKDHSVEILLWEDLSCVAQGLPSRARRSSVLPVQCANMLKRVMFCCIYTRAVRLACQKQAR